MNIKKKTLYLILTLMANTHIALGVEFKPRANYSLKLSGYTQKESQPIGHNFKFVFENKSTFNEKIILVNELKTLATSFNSDTTTNTRNDKSDQFELYLGDNYIQSKSSNHVLQIGYQTVVWGEAFGFNFADFINPRDLRESLYSDLAESRRSLLLLNSKSFFTSHEVSGSLQFLISPEPRFDRTLPIELFLGKKFPNYSFTVNKEKKIEPFKEYEYGSKASISALGVDLSLYYYSYFNRSPYYEISSLSANEITLNENHARQSNFGASLAKSLLDFTVRADFVKTPKYKINYSSNEGLKNEDSDLTNIVISIDTPTYNDYSAIFIYAQSELSKSLPQMYRDQSQKFGILKLTKNFDNDKNIEFSFTQEFVNNGQSIQSAVNLPLTALTEINIGAEFYLGNEQSYLSNLRNMNNIYISLKNFIQF